MGRKNQKESASKNKIPIPPELIEVFKRQNERLDKLEENQEKLAKVLNQQRKTFEEIIVAAKKAQGISKGQEKSRGQEAFVGLLAEALKPGPSPFEKMAMKVAMESMLAGTLINKAIARKIAGKEAAKAFEEVDKILEGKEE